MININNYNSVFTNNIMFVIIRYVPHDSALSYYYINKKIKCVQMEFTIKCRVSCAVWNKINLSNLLVRTMEYLNTDIDILTIKLHLTRITVTIMCSAFI